jgi:predicted dehydrogenase
MKICIMGAGLIGSERIEAVKHIIDTIDDTVSLIVYDPNIETLSKAENKYHVPVTSNVEDALQSNPDWIIISTPNHIVKQAAQQAFNVGAHVLLEKPFGRTLEECDEIIALKPPGCKLHVGFNYRFFAGISAALNDAQSGKFGRLISVNMILGHGNSPGMETSWKMDPARCGGCNTDLGGHLIDLVLQLACGKVSVDYAKSWAGYWNTGIDEEAHMMMSDETGTIFNAQTSMNRWRSTFRLEINGTEGYGIVDGRGRSYGPQSYRRGVRWGWLNGKNQADTEELVIDANDCKDSFIKETMAALGCSSNIKPCDHIDGRRVMELLEQCK